MQVKLLTLFPLLLLVACSQTRRVYEVTEVDRPPDVEGDSLAIEVERARITYTRPSVPTPDIAPARSVDVISTALDLSFDMAERVVRGTADVRAKSIRDDLDAFFLHAVGMEIHAIRAIPKGEAINFDYDGERLTIMPPRPMALGDTLDVRVEYTARPMDATGSDPRAFSGYGLHFVDAAGDDPFRPTQLWTLGQTENNRRWFPTWDYPNDKQTFDIALTVPDSMLTFGNGVLVESERVGSGLRRDRWVLYDYPSPSYVAALVAGRFAVVEDAFVRADSSVVPLQYIVEPEFRDDAKRIFGETPAMIRIFEDETGIPYPWPNYKQAVVRDFSAGGMENTTLTILHERVQTDPRAYLDYTARDLLAHELAHQWFGNLTTARDWGNLAVNESLASYFEEIYLERAFGRDAAQAHGIEDRSLYFAEAQERRRPIVWYGYEDESQMFDRQTYQKGGQVFNQLRFELGDAVWRRGLTRFLSDYAGESVEVDDLRRAFEAASGRSLRRFFSQWFHNPGHPSLNVVQAYFSGSGLYTVQVRQTQNLSEEPVFAFDVNVELNFPDGSRRLERVHLAAADTTLRFAVAEKPTFVRFDEGNWLLADINLSMPTDELRAMSSTDDEMAGRYDAVEALARLTDSPVAREALVAALADDHATVRRRAVQSLGSYLASPGVAEALARTARDEDPEVRAASLAVLSATENVGLLRGVLRRAVADSSYRVVATAVQIFADRLPEEAMDAYRAGDLLSLRSWMGTVELAVLEAIRDLDAGDEGSYVLARAAPENPDAVRIAATRAIVPLALGNVALREEARGRLRSNLSDRSRVLRLHAAEGLGRLGVESDIVALEEQLERERDRAVRAAIESALRDVRARSSGTQIGR